MTMSSAKEKPEEMEWSAEEEVQLFFALEGLKPVGVNKHFYMLAIAERLSRSLNREIPPECIWTHLKTMYNLEVLDEMEPLPFPNDQKDFYLPDTEFSSLMSRKRSECEDRKVEIKEKVPLVAKQTAPQKEPEKKLLASKPLLPEAPKRTPKRTRGSMSLESTSPSTTPPPPMSNNKRRRI